MSDDGAVSDADGSGRTREGDGQPTVTVGAEGFQPDADGQPTTAAPADADRPADREFGRSGWLLVGVVVVCFLVLPVAVTLRPVRTLGFWTTYLVLPLVPAVVLAATAVWVAVRGGR